MILVLCSEECLNDNSAVTKSSKARFDLDLHNEFEYYKQAIKSYLEGDAVERFDKRFRKMLSEDVIELCKKKAVAYVMAGTDRIDKSDVANILKQVKIAEKWSISQLKDAIPGFKEQYEYDTKMFEEASQTARNYEFYVKLSDIRGSENELALYSLIDYYYGLYVDCVNKKYELAESLKDTLNEIDSELVKLKEKKSKDIEECIKYYMYLENAKSNQTSDEIREYNQNVSIEKVELGDAYGHMKDVVNQIGIGAKVIVDIQGGDRISGYKRTALISLLEQRNVTVETVFSTDFHRDKAVSLIKDETKNYKISDFVSGINSFTQYGKAGKLVEYIGFVKDGAEYADLLNTIQEINDIVSVGDALKMGEKIEKLYKCLEALPDSEDEFVILKDEFRNNYKGVIKDGVVDKLGLIKWCIEKDFIQQALTLVEDMMPQLYFQRGIFKLVNCDSDTAKKLEWLTNSYRVEKENAIIYKNRLYWTIQEEIRGPVVNEIVNQLYIKNGEKLNEYREKSWKYQIKNELNVWLNTKESRNDYNAKINECKKLLDVINSNAKKDAVDRVEDLAKVLCISEDHKLRKARVFMRLSSLLEYDRLNKYDIRRNAYNNILSIVGNSKYKVTKEISLDLRVASKFVDNLDVINDNLNFYYTIRTQRNLVNHAKEADDKWTKEECIKQLNSYIQQFEELCEMA